MRRALTINPPVKGILAWEYFEVRKRCSNAMATWPGWTNYSASKNFPQKVMRSTLRLFLALSLVATITLVFFRGIHVNATSVGFFYLVAILVIATTGGLLEASVSSVVAMLCFNFFFLPPVGTFEIADPQNWVALFAFLVTAVVASHLSATVKKRAMEATRRQQEVERLYELSRALMLLDHQSPIAEEITYRIAQVFGLAGVA